MSTTKAPVGGTSQWFRQAIDMYQTAVKAGLQFQEESARRVTDMLAEFTPPQDWRKASQDFLDEMIQASQTSFDESIRAMTQSTRSGMELLQKAMESMPGGSMEESQTKVRELAEATLHAMRTNAQTAIQANSQMVGAWAEFAKRLAGERGGRSHS
jgi:hypothetical protein